MCNDSTNEVTMLLDVTRDFIRKHGGPASMHRIADALERVATDNEGHHFLARIAANRDIATELCATALLGAALAILVVESDAQRVEAN